MGAKGARQAPRSGLANVKQVYGSVSRLGYKAENRVAVLLDRPGYIVERLSAVEPDSSGLSA